MQDMIESNFKILSTKIEDTIVMTNGKLNMQEETLRNTYMNREKTIKYVNDLVESETGKINDYLGKISLA